MSETRLFKTFWVSQLEILVDAVWDRPRGLEANLRELQHRATARAAHLKSNVTSRLMELKERAFTCPRTHALPGQRKLVDGIFEYEIGLLGAVGYQVGKHGLGATERRDLLDLVYQESLPPIFAREYMGDWGSAKTGSRLHKMVDSIATFARNAKRRKDDRMCVAIAHWEGDLAYLKRTYCDGRYGFTWSARAIVESCAWRPGSARRSRHPPLRVPPLFTVRTSI